MSKALGLTTTLGGGVREEKGDTTYTTEIQWVTRDIREYF
jgi:hypothetical protein